MIKILFNCTTNNIGGGMKNSALFIVEALKISDSINWYFAISHGVHELLLKYGINVNEKFYVFESSPARSKASRIRLKDLEEIVRPDIIYTMAGPAYVKFSTYHILGLSSAYVTHPDWSILKLRRSLKDKIRLVVHIAFKAFYSMKADFFVFQTDQARNSYSKNFRIDINRTAVINNAFDSRLRDVLANIEMKDDKNKASYTIFCPGAAFDHKGLQFIPEIAKELSEMTDVPFEFVVTLPESKLLDEIKQQIDVLGVGRLVRNIGPFTYSDVAELYSNADIVFVPSLLETFTATYLEAMIAKKTLVVADKGFARDACKEAAFYVDPLNAKETAKTFAYIFRFPDELEEKVRSGEEILKKYGNQTKRFKKIVNLLISKL